MEYRWSIGNNLATKERKEGEMDEDGWRWMEMGGDISIYMCVCVCICERERRERRERVAGLRQVGGI
jgi:hypothetical protein